MSRSRIDALGARLDSRIGGLSARIDAQDASIQTQGRDLASAIQAQDATWPLPSRPRAGNSAPPSTPSRPGWTTILAVMRADSMLTVMHG